MTLAPVTSCPTVPLSNGLQIPIFGLGAFYFGNSWTPKMPPKQKWIDLTLLVTAYILSNIFSLYQARHIMADTLTMPLCTRSLSAACATLTQQSATAVRRNWVKLSEKVGYHEGICGSPINCGLGTTDTKPQKRPALTPAHGWGWNILVWVVIDKCHTET